MKRIIIATILVLLLSCGIALATDHYVATWGDNSSAGTSLDTAWAHPSYGVSQLTAGDTLYIVNGTYNEVAKMYFTTAHDGNLTHPVTVTAYNGTPILDGGKTPGVDTFNHGFDIYGADNYAVGDIIISNITLRNYDYGIFQVRYAKNITLDGLEIYGTYDVDGLGLIAATKNITINNCSFHAPVDYNGINIIGKRNSTTHNTTNLTITNCEFYDNHAHSMIQIANFVNNFKVNNNTFWNNTGSGGSFGLYVYDHAVTDAIKEGARDFVVQDLTLTDSRGIQVSDNYNGTFQDILITNCYEHGIQYKNITAGPEVMHDIIFRNITITNQTSYIQMYGGDDILFDEIHLINSTASVYDYLLRNMNNVTIRDEVEYLYSPLVQYNTDAIIEYTDGSVFKITYQDSSGSNITKQPAWYPNIANFSESTSGTGHRRFDIRKYNITLVPTNAYLKNVTVDHESTPTDDRTNITVNSSVSSNPTWINATMQNASSNYSISVDGSIVDYIDADSDGIVKYRYTSSWSPHSFEFSWVGAAPFPPDHTKAYYNATSPILNTINSTGYYLWNRTITASDIEMTSGSMVVTT